MSQINFIDFFKYYKDTKEQQDAVGILEFNLPRHLLEDDAAWVVKYREQPKVTTTNPLDVPYDCQLDNPSGDGWRECFSSSCAMVAMYWGAIDEPNEYHKVRPRFGDSTEPTAQIRTLQYFGLNARFGQLGSAEKLKAQIDRGRPAPVGFLHHGSPQAPSGGGHYIVCIGYNDSGFIFNDPYGKCRVEAADGGYPNPGPYGKSVVYQYQYWVPRWSVANDHDGWGLDVWKD